MTRDNVNAARNLPGCNHTWRKTKCINRYTGVCFAGFFVISARAASNK